jgi:hypothetical protein
MVVIGRFERTEAGIYEYLSQRSFSDPLILYSTKSIILAPPQ